jgi:hypothetical protein
MLLTRLPELWVRCFRSLVPLWGVLVLWDMGALLQVVQGLVQGQAVLLQADWLVSAQVPARGLPLALAA